MRPAPSLKVVQWLDSFPQMELWISAITVAEIWLGIAMLPDGKRSAL